MVKNQHIDPATLDLEDRVVEINRVTKVVKGGRTGKALEVPEAIRKAIDDAKQNLIYVPTVGTTIQHEVIGSHSGGRVMLKPAVAGSGVSAGGPVRAVLELAGVADVTSKSLGSNTPINMIRATLDGITKLKKVEDVAKLRGKSVEELLG